MKIEGKNPVFEVRNSGLNIDKLLIQSNLRSCTVFSKIPQRN